MMSPALNARGFKLLDFTTVQPALSLRPSHNGRCSLLPWCIWILGKPATNCEICSPVNISSNGYFFLFKPCMRRVTSLIGQTLMSWVPDSVNLRLFEDFWQDPLHMAAIKAGKNLSLESCFISV